MPRRSPPSSLRLVSGPIPTRGQPKHTLPVAPQPTFYPKPSSTQLRATQTVMPPLISSYLEEQMSQAVLKQDSNLDVDSNGVHPSSSESAASGSSDSDTHWVRSWIPLQTEPFVFDVGLVLPSLPKAIVINSYSWGHCTSGAGHRWIAIIIGLFP